MDDRLRRALYGDDPYARYWAVCWGVRGVVDPTTWLPRVLAVCRDDPALEKPVYDTLRTVDWSALKGPLAAVLFDTTADADLRAMLWMFWAEHEVDVPDCPSERDLLEAFDFVGQDRAERIWCERGHCDDELLTLCAIARGVDPPIADLLEELATADEVVIDEIWRELMQPFGTLGDGPLPTRAILDTLPEPLRSRARALADGVAEHALGEDLVDRLLLRVGTRTAREELSAEALVDVIVVDGHVSVHDRGLLHRRLRDDDHARALATRAIDAPPRVLLAMFGDRIPTHTGELLADHWATRPTHQLLDDVLAANPTVLRIVAGPFLDGEHAEDTLAALATADPTWATPLLLPRLDGLLGRLRDETPLFRTLAGLADPAFLPFLETRHLPYHLQRGWAWCTVCSVNARPEPDIAIPDPDAEVIDHPTVIRVRCTDCDRWTTHAVSGIVVIDPILLEDRTLPAPEGWDGVMPNEVLVCPACGTADRYHVDRFHREPLEIPAMRRSVQDPRRIVREGVTATPRVFADVIATRPSTTEARLLDLLRAENTSSSRKTWLSFLQVTQRDDQRLTEARRITAAHPDDAEPWWYLALAEETGGDHDAAVVAATVALSRPLPIGALDDCLGILADHADVEHLVVRWRYEGRVLTGVLDLAEVDGARFLAEVDVVEAAPSEPGPPGWIERWMSGERPASRQEVRAAQRKKKKARARSRRRR